MSSMASNYDMTRLLLGQVAAILACIFGTASLLSGSGPGSASAAIPLTFAALLYGIMMFGSSYVEEEHHFWYWLTSGWLASLAVRRLRRCVGTLALNVILRVKP